MFGSKLLLTRGQLHRIELNSYDPSSGEVWLLPVHLRELLTAGGARDANRLTLLRTIMAKPGPQAYLARRSGQSPATVSDAMKELAARGFIREPNSSAKDGRTRILRIAPTAGAAVGIELGFRYAAVVARRVEQEYEEAQVRLCRAGAASTPGRWVDEVADAVRDAVNDLQEEEIVTIGLGVPRMVNPQTGGLVPPALPPWNEGDDPARMLEDKLRADRHAPRMAAPRVVLDNDANLAAYAESIYEFENAETLIGVKASTGVGAGIVVGGKIFRGGCGVAGEIGHMVVDPNGRFCACGGRGCLETIVGADALVEQAKTVLGHKKQESPQTLEDLVQMAGHGNLACQRVLKEAAETLGFALGNLCNVLNPNVLVLSGAIGRADAVKHTLPPCEAAIRQSAMRAAVDDGPMVRATSISHPAAHGALVVALEGTTFKPASGQGHSRAVRSA